MNKTNPKVVVGFIIFGNHTAKYLPYFLDSLKNQTYQDFRAICLDNLRLGQGEARALKDETSTEYLKDNYPELEIIDSPRNSGFGRSHNKMIDRAFRLRAEYYLVINSDAIMEPDALEKLVQTLDDNKNLSAVCPKVFKWDFSNNEKTNVIDTLGIGLKSGLMFYDVGQGKIDEHYPNHRIIGPSGACGLYRLAALADVSEPGEYFDKNMFMYKEDCDLAYRLYLSGHKSKCVFESIIYHDRTASSRQGLLGALKNRRKKSARVNRWSFFNQQIIFFKYWHREDLFSKIKIVLWQITALIYALIFEQYLFVEYFKFLKLKKSLRRHN